MDIELTTDNLEYISFVAQKYCDPYDTGCSDLVIATAHYYFMQRIGIVEDSKMYDLYLNTDNMQKSLRKYHLNPNKFWLLILFLKDFTNSCYGATHVYDNISVGENAEKMIQMLANAPLSADCEITISNGKESATINATWVESLILSKSIEELKGIYPMVKVDPNNQINHKIKFFMEMLDYFLLHFDSTYSKETKNTKDWEFTAKVLYLSHFLDATKYFYGYEEVRTPQGQLLREKAKYIGKTLKNATKNLKDTSERYKSDYCFIPDFG